jgi:hypothetical protein
LLSKRVALCRRYAWEFSKLLKSSAQWNFIRLGWRPYGMAAPKEDACPDACKCASTGSRTCVLQVRLCTSVFVWNYNTISDIAWKQNEL